MRILVVDDNSDAAETLADLLSLSGFDARWTASGRKAMEMLREAPPDALIADYLIPDVRSETLIAEAKAVRPAMLVLVWTGSANDVARLRANPAVDQVVLKPAGSFEIVEWLRSKQR